MKQKIILCLANIFFLATSAFAQSAPDIIFRVKTGEGYSGPFINWTVPGSSWDQTQTFTSGSNYGEIKYSGSTSSVSITITGSSTQSGTGNLGLLESKTEIEAYVKGNPSATVSAISTATLNSNVSAATYISYNLFGYIPFSSPAALVNAHVTGAGSNSNSYNGTPSAQYNFACNSGIIFSSSQYPGVAYSKIPLHAVLTSTQSQAGFSGSLSSSATTTYYIDLTSAPPVARISDPLVAGVPATPQLGDSVTFNNLSYDQDNQPGAIPPLAPLTGICSTQWTVDRPDGTQSIYTTPSSVTFAVQRQGMYVVTLNVTDNEGQTSQTSTNFVVGPDREPGPGSDQRDQPHKEVNCKDPWTTSGVNLVSGNYYLSANDPVPTRGYPLKCNLHYNSQSHIPSKVTAAGNFSFTYGVEIRQVPIPAVGGSTHWLLIDGDGSEYDFGPASGSPIAPAGFYSTLTVNSSGYTLSNAGELEEIHKAGNFTYEFDSNGKLTSLIDPAGNTQEVTYNTSGYPDQVTDLNSNKVLNFEYDSVGKIARIVQNGGGAITHINYDGSKIDHIELKNALGTTVRELDINYNSNGLISDITRDADTATTLTIAYKNAGNDVFVANILGGGTTTNLDYSFAPPSGSIFRTGEKNSKGGTVYYDIDSGLDIKKVTRPKYNGAAVDTEYTLTHDSNHNLTSTSDGSTTLTMSYTSNGKVYQIADGVDTQTFTYNGVNLTQIQDSIGILSTIGYTDTNHPNIPTTFSDSLSHTWSRTLNAYGQVLSIIPPSGAPLGTTYYTYDEASLSPTFGYLQSITNGNGEVTTVDSYTSLGDIESITTYPSTSTTNSKTYSYDAAQRVTSLTYGDGKSVQMAYTGSDLVSLTDENASATSYDYCAICGRLSGINFPMSKSISWMFDADNDLSKFTDPRNKDTTYSFGASRELKQITYPDTTAKKYTYDNSGRLKRVNTSRNFNKDLTYNSTGKVATFGQSNVPLMTYAYNSDGTVQSVTNQPGNTTYTYTANRLVATISHNYSSFSLTPVQKVSYTYNTDNSVATVKWESGTTTVATWTYSYDGAGKISSIQNNFGETTSFTYDGEGKLLTQTNSNGTSTNHGYNDYRGWPTSIAYKLGGTDFASYNIVYDGSSNSVGNLSSVTELDGSVASYTYDSLYRLLSETRTGTSPYSRTYTYDLSGNILTVNGSTFGTYNDANRFATFPAGSVTYDGDANTSLANTGTMSTNFYWSVSNTLTQQAKGSNYLNGWYDGGMKRRISELTTSGTKKFYIYDRGNVIGEINASGATRVAAYTWGPNGLVSERLLTGTPKSLWYHFGPQGETRQLTNSSGAVVDSYVYNAYGIPIASSGTDVNPYKYGGKYGYYTESFSSIILAGTRWYHPYLMRWLSRDPIGYAGGSNLYEYVASNPAKYFDSDGHSPASIVLGAAPVIGEGAAGVGAVGLGAVGAGVGVGIGVATLSYCFFEPEICEDAVYSCDQAQALPIVGSRIRCGKEYSDETTRCHKLLNPVQRRICLENAQAAYLKCLGKAPVDVKR